MYYNKIINPVNGKQINIFSTEALNVLKNYIYALGGHEGPCVLNSKTKRCRKA